MMTPEEKQDIENTKAGVKILKGLGLVVYCFIGMLTFASAYNHHLESLQASPSFSNVIPSIFSGFFWPLYWLTWIIPG